MKTILVSAVGGDIGYGIIKALKESGAPLRFIGFDIRKFNASSDLMDEFYVSPPYREEEKWLNFVTGLVHDCHADYFWPVTEPEIRIVDRNRELFNGTTLVINSSSILRIALNKALTAAVLRDGGIPTPETWERTDTVSRPYPLIVKEAFGCGSHSVCLVNSREELEAAFQGMQAPVVQECIGSPEEEYTLTVFSDGNTVNFIAFKRSLGFGGMSRYVELAEDEKLADLACRLSGLLELRGSVNVQMRKQNGRYYVFEINPRISSTIGFRVKLGFNDAAWWLDLLNGRAVEQYHCPHRKAVGVRTVEEKIFFD